jgi:hypothetical protein
MKKLNHRNNVKKKLKRGRRTEINGTRKSSQILLNFREKD